MRAAAAVLATGLLLLGPACSGAGDDLGGDSSAGIPSAEACRLLTASDVEAVLAVRVSGRPATSPPPVTSSARLLEACSYGSDDAPAGASLYLFRDLPAAAFAGVPGYRPVPGIGDQAFSGPSILVVQKGETTFQLLVVTNADREQKDRMLLDLGRAVAKRL